MALQVQIQMIRSVGPVVEVWGKLMASGTYTTGLGGDTVNFLTATLDPSFSGPATTIESSQQPFQFDVWSQGGQNTDFYTANLSNTTGPSNVQMMVSTALNTELTTQAYPAGVKADNIAFYAAFKKGQ